MTPIIYINPTSLNISSSPQEGYEPYISVKEATRSQAQSDAKTISAVRAIFHAIVDRDCYYKISIIQSLVIVAFIFSHTLFTEYTTPVALISLIILVVFQCVQRYVIQPIKHESIQELEITMDDVLPPDDDNTDATT